MPKILWMSPYSLLDKSSGASVNALQMLQYLQNRGFEVWSCSAFCCDNPSGAQEMLSKLHLNNLSSNQQPVFTLNQDGISFFFTRCHSTQEYDMTIEECQLFYSVYLKILDEFKPDFVIGYGLSPLPILCRYETQRRGIAVIQLVVNGEQRGFNFPFIDLALTESFATGDYYAQYSHLNLRSTGIFCDQKAYVAPFRQPQFVTMINPSPNKGASILAKLVSVCEERFPEIKFLVIESRAKFYEVVEQLHTKDNKEEFPLKGRRFKNLHILPLQSQMQNVYAVTSVLLVPSLWFESWGRVNTEAALNHIPVLSSTSGGIREAFGGAGISLTAPQHCRDDYFSLPSDAEIEPWVVALQTLLTQNWDEEFANVHKLHAQQTSYLRLANLLHQLRPYAVPQNNLKLPFDYVRLNRLYAPQSLKLDTSIPQTLLSNEAKDNLHSPRPQEMLSANVGHLTLDMENVSSSSSAELKIKAITQDNASSCEEDTGDISASYTLEPEAFMPWQPEHFDHKFMEAFANVTFETPAQDMGYKESDESGAESQASAWTALHNHEINSPTISDQKHIARQEQETQQRTASNAWAQHCNELDLSDILASLALA